MYLRIHPQVDAYARQGRAEALVVGKLVVLCSILTSPAAPPHAIVQSSLVLARCPAIKGTIGRRCDMGDRCFPAAPDGSSSRYSSDSALSATRPGSSCALDELHHNEPSVRASGSGHRGQPAHWWDMANAAARHRNALLEGDACVRHCVHRGSMRLPCSR